MSEKQVKLERKQPKLHIVITIDDQGRLQVMNFPDNPQAALQIMHDATRLVAAHFINKAAGGQFEQNRIVVPTPMVDPKKIRLS